MRAATLRLFATSLLGLFLINAAVQAATITGRVRDINNDSYMFGAVVTIQELNRSANTQSDGTYTFHNVPAGNYTLSTSYVGYSEKTTTVQVAEGADTRADIAMGDEVLKLGNFIVSGEREGQARAIQQKRNADNIIDVVSADSAGKLPDGNAAEAVRRLPGVFAEIDQNEGRYIVVRGIDSALNNTTINGVTIGSPESGTRGAAMDSVPADLISRIEVVKAVTPDMDAQAVGASVNVVTPSAFDRKEAFGSITVAGGYYNGPRDEFAENSTTPVSASGIYGTQFGGGKWGLVLGGSYSYRHYISNRQSGGIPWFPAGPAGTPGADIYFPSVDALFHYDVQRWREGANMTLEFKPNDQNYFAFRITDNQFQDTEGRELDSFEFFRTTYPASYTATTATFTGGRSTVEYRYYRQEHNITNYSLEGRHNLNPDTKLTYVVAVGNAEKQTPDRQDWEFRTAANLTSSIDTSTFHWDLEPGAAYFQASSYPFRRVRFRKDDEHEDNANGRIDLNQATTKLGKNGFWQVGVKYFTRDKGWNRENSDYLAGTGSNLFNLSQYNLSTPPHEVFGGYRQMAPQINLANAQALFKSNPNLFVVNAAGNLSDSNVTDFSMEENILAGYAEAKYGADKWSVLAGIRAENTDADVTQTQLPTNGSTAQQPTYNHITKKYTNVLPGVHFRATPTKQWVLRASWTNTIGRPNYPDMAGAAQYTYVEDLPTGSGIYTGSITSGNPNLEPYESMNLDFSSEYYFKHQGMLAVGLFYKRLDNPIFTNAGLLRNVVYDGKNFSSLSYSRPENADSGKIQGIEFNYTQDFTMLPSPFDGLRFSVNATFSDSEENLFSRPTEDLRFIKQPNKIYNIALGYEKYGFQARVAYTFTGDFIKSFGADVNGDSYQSERKIVDAKISYRINKHFTVFADVINIGEEPLSEFAGYANRMSATESYWWTANFGVTWKL